MGGDMVGGNMGDMVGGNMGGSVHVRHTTQTTSATSTRAISIPQDPFPCPRSADNAGAAALVFLATKGNSVEDLVVFLANGCFSQIGGMPHPSDRGAGAQWKRRAESIRRRRAVECVSSRSRE